MTDSCFQDAGPSEPRRRLRVARETKRMWEAPGGEIFLFLFVLVSFCCFFFLCKCTHRTFCLIIMCNVAALTFYATIYEDICCICNKSREKDVLGTAGTAGSLCCWLFRPPGLTGVTTYNHVVHFKDFGLNKT